MTEEVKQPERDPLLDKEVTLKFTVEQLNGILNLLGNELPFIKAVGLINEIQRQSAEQLIPEAADEQ
jgi:hypothetical protein